MTERSDAIVIGAGHNGLVCATYLARAGSNVLCLEATGAAGGMSAPHTLGEHYRLPGLAHVAYPVGASIRRDLDLDRFGYAPGPAVDTVALVGDRRHLVIGRDGVSGPGLPEADAAVYRQFRDRYLAFAAALRPLFENKPPRLKDMDFRDKTNLAKLGWKLRFGLGREAMYEFLRVAAINIHDVLNDTFDDERLKGAIAADAVLGNAMGPRTPGTVLTWLQRLYGELEGPLALQTGDESQLVNALRQSAEDAGVTIRLDAPVERVLVHDGRATGVRLSNGETFEAATVISNADPRTTFLDLVGAPLLDTMFANRVTQIRGAGVVAKLYLALNGKPDFPELPDAQLGQRLLVAPSMKYVEHAFNHSKYREYSERPVLDIVIPSLHNPALAPDGHHVMSVNVAFAPYELKGGWEPQKEAFADRVVSLLSEYCDNLDSLIAKRELLTPRDIERRFGAAQGHWHHGDLGIHQSFMMRPVHGAAQYDTPVQGLFLCGAGCHPGGGLTGLPGRNAAKRVLEIRGVV
jgi:phytoene dehydrogenase-like protein